MFRSVLSPAECKRALALTWDWLEATAPGGVLDRNNTATWGDWPPTVEGGILPYGGAGQSRAAWFVRGRPRVHAAFAQIWGEAKLISSFDALAVWRPWEERPSVGTTSTVGSAAGWIRRAAGWWRLGLGSCVRGLIEPLRESWRRRQWRTERGWFHIDQNPLLKPVPQLSGPLGLMDSP